jgi:predicted O-methyltransferase YrrM
MSKFIAVDEALHAYILAHRTPDDDLLRALQEETGRLGDRAVMQIAPDQGNLLQILVAAIGARRAVEVGTFTGMSALCVARGMGPQGRLLCCDVSEEWTSIARRYWDKAGVADRIELRLGPAADTLRSLPVEPTFDFAFIDADKASYPIYYEEILKRLRPGGLVTVDNVLWSGDVVRPDKQEADVVAIRRFNELVAADRRVEAVIVPIADGLTIARKR